MTEMKWSRDMKKAELLQEFCVMQEAFNKAKQELLFEQAKGRTDRQNLAEMYRLLTGLVQFTRGIAVCKLLDSGATHEGFDIIERRLEVLCEQARSLIPVGR